MAHQVKRYHDFCAGHRVVGHESKCRHLHGHNYRVHFVCQQMANTFIPVADGDGLCVKAPELDSVGRVIDFSVVKEKLCVWLEDNWDHKFLHWEDDDLINGLKSLVRNDEHCERGYPVFYDNPKDKNDFMHSLVEVPFNPTAENMAQYLVEVIGPRQLHGTGVELVEVTIEETAKCHVTYKKDK